MKDVEAEFGFGMETPEIAKQKRLERELIASVFAGWRLQVGTL